MFRVWLLFLLGCTVQTQKNSVASIVALTERYESVDSYYPNQLANELAQTMNLSRPVSVVILKTNDRFALSSENGRVLISSGLIKQLPNEAAFAFVIAHELAHIHLNHFSGVPSEEDADKLGLIVLYKAGFSPHHAVFAHGDITKSRSGNLNEVLKSLPLDFVGIIDRDVFQKYRLGL